ncbi:MAG: hypothetical protein R3F62_19380 [Planctomycetota bacterium]
MAARGWAWATLGLALLGLAWRVALGGAPPATFDEVSFQRALTQFDLLAFEPHFPGYALSVFLARIPAALGSAAPYAWSAGLLGLALTPALYRAGGGGPGGTLAVAALALSPLALSVGARPLADGGASALAAGGVALAWRALEAGRAPWAAAWILGAAAAAKPDYALFGSALLPGLAREGWRRRAGLLAVWALGPLAATWAAAGGAGGVAPLLAEAERFVRGHVSEWGGTVASDRGPRLARFGLPLGAAGGDPGSPAWRWGGSSRATRPSRRAARRCGRRCPTRSTRSTARTSRTRGTCCRWCSWARCSPAAG